MAHRHLPLVLALAALAAPAGAQEMEPEKWAREVASPDAGVRYQAADQLGRCASYCQGAAPALVKMLQLPDSSDQSQAGFALHQIIQDVQARASMEGKDERAASAAECRDILAVLRPRLKGAAPAPLEGQLAEVAALKLLGLCAEAEDVPALVAVMSAPAFSVNARQAALIALAQIGPPAAAAVPAIKALGTNPADDSGAYLKTVAKEVLPRIQPPPAPVKKKKK
jgi:hypothetical protein